MANIPESSKAKDRVRKPKFSKIMLGDFDHHLRVPRMFVERYGETLTVHCKLKGPSGREWRVQVGWVENDVMFLSGWNSFVREHRLEHSDFLMFTYEGNSTFDVFVFEKTGCEREESMMSGGETIEEDTDFSENRVENENKRRNSDLNCVYKGKLKVRTLRRDSLSRNASDNANVDDNGLSAEDDIDDIDDTDDVHEKGESETEVSSYGSCVLKTPGKQIQKCHVSSRRDVTDEEKEAARAKAGAYVNRRKTSGVAVVGIILQRTHVYKGLYLTFPKNWAMENMVKEKHDVELRVIGSEIYWLVGCRWTSSGQCQLRPKWAEFVFDNNLEEGDTCVFELVSKGVENGKTRAVFKVRIFRVVEKISPLISKRMSGRFCGSASVKTVI